MDDMEFRLKLYNDYKQELLNRDRQNTEAQDRAILTLSTAGLGFSSAFIKDIVPIEFATWVCLLHISWYMFGAAIVTTISSFYVGHHAIKDQLKIAEAYYPECKEENFKITKFAKYIEWMNHSAGIFFVVAVILTILFVSINVERGVTMKTNKSNTRQIKESATIPTMPRLQPEKVGKATTIPPMQHLKPAPQQPATQQGGQSGNQSGTTTNQPQPNTSGGSDKK